MAISSDYSYAVGSNGSATASTFGFSNAGQIGNDITAAGAIIGAASSWMSGNALQSAANTTVQTGTMNRAIYYQRAAVQDENAKYIKWKGDYEATRTRQEADINLGLASATYKEQMRAADIMLQSANRTLELSKAKAAEFGNEASATWTAATTRSLRTFQQARGILGAQRVATAKSGFVMAGSELDSLLENANRLELARVDELKTEAEKVRQLKFASTMTTYEGEQTAWQQGENFRALTFTANIDKYKADVTHWNAEQTAQVILAEAKQSRWNLLQSAKDLRAQGDLALKEAQARQAALEAQGEAQKTSGILKALTTVAGIVAAPMTGGASLAIAGAANSAY